MSEDGKKYAANLAKLLAERADAIRLLERVFMCLDDAVDDHDDVVLDSMRREVDRFLMLVERP